MFRGGFALPDIDFTAPQLLCALSQNMAFLCGGGSGMAQDEFEETELPLETAGQRLLRAREAAGMSLDDVSARTKIARRHLDAIEEDRFADLAGRTYAVGFARSHARVVGLNEAEIVDVVRGQLASEEAELWPEPQRESFEPGDPARVPPARLAWIAALAALVVLGLVLFFWRPFAAPAVTLPDLVKDEPAKAVAKTDAKPAGSGSTGAMAPKPGDPGGAVVFTATEPDVWVKFYDESGEQLFQKQMAQGERYTIPADAKGPQIWTGRPDALSITVGGREVPMLGDGPQNIKDVPVSAAALLGRPAREPEAQDEADGGDT